MARGGIGETGAVHRRDQRPTGTVTFLFTDVDDARRFVTAFVLPGVAADHDRLPAGGLAAPVA